MDSQAIPLVVGVTGHRALRPDDEALLREKLGEIFGELGTRYGGTPLLLLTSLAEGADRLVAEVGRELEIPFLVPLPMERKEYEKDFVAAGSLEKFNALMAAAEGSFELSFMPGLTGEDVGDPANRAEQYAAAGKYILRHSHVLLALWDGDQAEKTGGTSQMVRYRLTGYPPLSGPELGWLYPPEVGPVYHLVTPREGKPEPADKFAVRRYYTGQLYAEKEEGEEKALAGKEKEKEKEAKEQEKREGQAEKIFDLMLRRTASFNRDVENHPPSEAARRRSAAGLRPPGVPEEDEAREALVARFVAADALARRFRNWRWLLFGALMVFMIPASFFLSGYDRPGEKSDAQDISRWLFTGSVLAAVAVLCFVRWWRIEAKFLDYRALAEGWKILYFWRMAGLEEDVSEQYLRLQRSELNWIRCAIRTSDLPNAILSAPLNPFPWIGAAWLEDQRRYFKRRARRSGFSAKVLDVLVGSLLGACLAFFSMIVLHWVRPTFPDLEWNRLLILMVSIAGVAIGGREKLGVSYHAKQYEGMHRFFERAEKKYRGLLQEGDTGRLRETLRAVGHEALQENGDWLLLHRERPMEIPMS